MKTKIILTEKPEQIKVCEGLKKEIKKAIFLALRKKDMLTQKKCEECLKRV